jgi:hypothetical protein
MTQPIALWLRAQTPAELTARPQDGDKLAQALVSAGGAAPTGPGIRSCGPTSPPAPCCRPSPPAS